MRLGGLLCSTTQRRQMRLLNQVNRFGTMASNNPEKSVENVARVSRKLSDVLNIDLLSHATTKEVSEIWENFHSEKYCIAAVITPEMFRHLRSRWEKYPIFLIPSPKGQGAEFYVFQYSENMAAFMKLQLYQLYQQQDDPADTPPSLKMMHYTDFIDSKQVVLMRGEIDPTQIDIQEAQTLANQLQLYYLSDTQYKLVQEFNDSPSTFDYNSLLEIHLPE